MATALTWACSMSLEMSRCPLAAAMWRGVVPTGHMQYVSPHSTWAEAQAPNCSRDCTAGRWPPAAAKCSGVRPDWDLTLAKRLQSMGGGVSHLCKQGRNHCRLQQLQEAARRLCRGLSRADRQGGVLQGKTEREG